MAIFSEFLARNSVQSGGTLPLIHSSRAFHLRSFQNTNIIKTTSCDVFVGEKLNYFFVGRPAYKFQSADSESAHWEYPCCFIFDYEAVGHTRRMFPFDSGAFERKLYPSYTTMMDRNEFEVDASKETISRIIGSYFGNVNDYFSFCPKSEKEFVKEFSIEAMDAELYALHRLSMEKRATRFDDRRFTIEVQTDSDLDLRTQHPIAVVAPSQYFDMQKFCDHVVDVWHAEPIPYPIFSLSISNCYGQIYERCLELFKRRGLV